MTILVASQEAQTVQHHQDTPHTEGGTPTFDEDMFGAWLRFYGILPHEARHGLKKAIGTAENEDNGLELCTVAAASRAGFSTWVHINGLPIGFTRTKARIIDIVSIRTIFLDFEYPPDPNVAIQTGRAFIERLANEGFVLENHPLEISGAGCHLGIPIAPIQCFAEDAPRYNAAIARVVKRVLDPLFQFARQDAETRQQEMELECYDIPRVASGCGTWRASTKPSDAPSLKNGFLRRWDEPYVEGVYPVREDSLSPLLRECIFRQLTEMDAEQEERDRLRKAAKERAEQFSDYDLADMEIRLRRYAQKKPTPLRKDGSGRPDRSRRMIQLVGWMLTTYDDDERAVHALDFLLNELTGYKFDQRLTAQLDDSIAYCRRQGEENMKQEQPTSKAEGAQQSATFVTLSEDDVETLPDAVPLIDPLLFKKSVSLVFGETGTGKTFFAVHTAECVARAMSWFGHECRQGPVLYVYAEGTTGVKRRVMAWKNYHQQPSTPFLRFITQPVQLIGERAQLLATVDALKDDATCGLPVLLIIDTFSNCSITVNQNAQEEVFHALATAHEIARTYEMHVMIVHHTNKDAKFNGSMAFRNHCDTMIELVRAADSPTITVHCVKQRDEEPFADFCIEGESVAAYTNTRTGNVVTSLALKRSTTLRATCTYEQRLPQKQKEILGLLGADRLTNAEWERRAKEADIAHSTFITARNSLLKQRLVEHVESVYQRTQPAL